MDQRVWCLIHPGRTACPSTLSLVNRWGQEKGLRAGTLNTPGIVGFGEAYRLGSQRLPEESTRIVALRDRLEEAVLDAIPGVRGNGKLETRLPGNSSLTFPGIDAEALVINMPVLPISTGSACTSGLPNHRPCCWLSVSQGRGE